LSRGSDLAWEREKELHLELSMDARLGAGTGCRTVRRSVFSRGWYWGENWDALLEPVRE